MSDHTIVVIWVMKIFFVQCFCVFLPPLFNTFCFCYIKIPIRKSSPENIVHSCSSISKTQTTQEKYVPKIKKGHFCAGVIPIAIRHMKRCSQHHWLLEKGKSKVQWGITSHQSQWPSPNISNNKRWSGCGEKGALLPCCWECMLAPPLGRRVLRFLKKLNTEVP